MVEENLENKTKTKDLLGQEISERVISGLFGAAVGGIGCGGFIYLATKDSLENPMKAAYIVGTIAAVVCGLYFFGGCSWDAEDDQIREKYDNIRKRYAEDMKKTKQ